MALYFLHITPSRALRVAVVERALAEAVDNVDLGEEGDVHELRHVHHVPLRAIAKIHPHGARRLLETSRTGSKQSLRPRPGLLIVFRGRRPHTGE